MEPDSLSLRVHLRLIVAAAILAAVCWGGLIYWQGVDRLPGSGILEGPGPYVSPMPGAPVLVVPPQPTP
jgi:hypothetical protein